MQLAPVEFSYIPSLYGDFLPGWQAVLVGSWDARGQLSDAWSEHPMTRSVAAEHELGVHFTASVALDPTQAGRVFAWGVYFVNDAGDRRWAITTEEDDPLSTQRHCTFAFSGGPQEARYFLTHCRRLGANRTRLGDEEATRFAVWAPNALAVDLVFGVIWKYGDPQRTIKEGPLLKTELAGGYVHDCGLGLDPTFAPAPMTKGEDGVWETVLPGGFSAYDHQPYMFRITREDGHPVYRTDLYSRCQMGFGALDPAVAPWSGLLSELMGTVSCSAVIDPETVTQLFDEPEFPERTFIPESEFWADEFTERRTPQHIDDLIIYELHLGALGFGSDKPGTLADAIALLDHIQAANFNAVELLPLSEFGGGGENWGYATSHYFAIEYSGGGRDQFKHFVKECHRRGLAVIFDVVYNHYTVDGGDRAQWLYDSIHHQNNIYYWYEGDPADHGAPTGGYVNNNSSGWAPRYHEAMVRTMFISSAVSLVRDFHVDGFRVDQTTCIHRDNSLNEDGRSVPAANQYGAKLLRELGATLRLIKPNIFLMAEDHSGWDAVTTPVEAGGMGFDAQWFSEFYHALSGDTNAGDAAKLLHRAALTQGSGPLAMDNFAHRLWETQFAKVVYSESHDEAGNSEGPLFDPTWDGDEPSKRHTSHRSIVVASNNAPLIDETRRFAEARCRFAWGVTVLSAGVPMVLFGEEVGARNRFKYNAVLAHKEDYLGMAQEEGRALLAFFTDVNALRLARSGLRSRSIDIVHVSNDNRVIVFRRWNDTEQYLVCASLADHPYAQGYAIHNERIPVGHWRELFNSDNSLYGGDAMGNHDKLITSQGGAMTAVIPAAGFVVLEMER